MANKAPPVAMPDAVPVLLSWRLFRRQPSGLGGLADLVQQQGEQMS
jgi:hypothetical protein